MDLNAFLFWDVFLPHALAFLSYLFQLSRSFTACCFWKFHQCGLTDLLEWLCFFVSAFFLLYAFVLGKNNVPKQQFQLKLNKLTLKCSRISPGHWMSHTLQREAQAFWIFILSCKRTVLCLSQITICKQHSFSEQCQVSSSRSERQADHSRDL